MAQVGEQVTSVSAPIIKSGSTAFAAWATWGINSWSDIAAIAAALLSIALFLEWLYKKIIRPFCESRGWLVRHRRRREDFE